MFLLSQNDENQSENGSKNSKIRLWARPPAEPQKKMLQTKKLRSKSWKTRGFFTFRLPILDGRVHGQVSSVLFFTVFFEGERHDLSKTGGFGRKMPPPPGKPVTFYECHPDDHAPAPSVRADFQDLPSAPGWKAWCDVAWQGCWSQQISPVAPVPMGFHEWTASLRLVEMAPRMFDWQRRQSWNVMKSCHLWVETVSHTGWLLIHKFARILSMKPS